MRALIAVLTLVSGCAAAPVVATEELPLSRVVIYRNGVAYFERSGRVDKDKVAFRVRPDHVGDFLATLSVVEQGGSSVRSAAFPMGTAAEGSSDGRETVILELDGAGHELSVGYIAEQPVWRPSYRVLLTAGQPVLQAWGIVQNVSGEDWKDVSLSLVAGAPLAFRADLAALVTPERPTISDRGEIIASVPRGENTLAQEMPSEEMAGMPAPPMAAPMAPSAPGMASKKRGMAPQPRAGAKAEYAPPDYAERASPRPNALLASTAVMGGTTRYDLPAKVTIPDQSATMVMILSQSVPGEAVFMFAPDGGVPDSARFPFHVVRFKNSTPGLLERGPISVLESGAFLGQGLMEPLPEGAEATVPFALERGIAVDTDRKHEQRDARLARIEAGALTLEQDQVMKTTYRVRNGTAAEVKVLVKHARQQGTRLHKAPVGTDDRVGQGDALVPAKLAARATETLAIDERRAFTTPSDWFNPTADEAVRAYLGDKRADPKVVKPLGEAWDLRAKIVAANQERAKLEGERAILSQSAEQTRENLKSIQKSTSKGIEQLRDQLAARLSELDKRLGDMAKDIVELDLRRNELGIRFNEKVQSVRLDQPLPEA